MDKYNTILNYWFGNLNDKNEIDKSSIIVKRWFNKSESTDKDIKDKFEEDLIKAKEGQYSDWKKDPKGLLALVILFDQFTRNIYRDTPKMFSCDDLALKLSNHATEEGMDEPLQFFERKFLYMPLMHSEDIEIQKYSLTCYKWLLDDAAAARSPNVPYYENTLDFAQRHHNIIQRFGRFPHRNIVLGRESTDKELEFLKTPGSSF